MTPDRPLRAADSPTGGGDPLRVEVEGRAPLVVSESDDFPRATRACTVECASGVRSADEWTGVPIPALADAAAFPDETTHLRVEADDFAAEVPVRAALDGILAFERSEGDGSGLPRFVADGVPGERLVKRVESVSPVALDPEDDPLVG